MRCQKILDRRCAVHAGRLDRLLRHHEQPGEHDDRHRRHAAPDVGEQHRRHGRVRARQPVELRQPDDAEEVVHPSAAGVQQRPPGDRRCDPGHHQRQDVERPERGDAADRAGQQERETDPEGHLDHDPDAREYQRVPDGLVRLRVVQDLAVIDQAREPVGRLDRLVVGEAQVDPEGNRDEGNCGDNDEAGQRREAEEPLVQLPPDPRRGGPGAPLEGARPATGRESGLLVTLSSATLNPRSGSASQVEAVQRGGHLTLQRADARRW